MKGIRKRIMLGFFLLGFLLFFAGLISYFELSRMSRSTEGLLNSSLQNLQLSKQMLEAAQEQNSALLQMVVSGVAPSNITLINSRKRFEQALTEAAKTIRNISTLDTLYKVHLLYEDLVDQRLTANDRSLSDVQWFTGIYVAPYNELITQINHYMISSQQLMDGRVRELEENAYRAAISGVIALGIAIVILLVFFYFIDTYYITPVLRINKGLYNFIHSKLPYSPIFQGQDEVKQLSELIENMVNQLKVKKQDSSIL